VQRLEIGGEIAAMSRLLSLPPELRHQIWDELLAPNSTTRPGTNDASTLTAVSRSCSSNGYVFGNKFHAHAHEYDDEKCKCLRRSFYVYDHSKKPHPVILRVNKQIYREALPSLYERRTFTVDPNRIFVSLWDRIAEAWFLFDRFLQGLPYSSRLLIKSIRIPMLLSQFGVAGARQAFYSIARQLPNLQVVEFEVSPSSVRECWLLGGHEVQSTLHGIIDPSFASDCYRLGPIMAFADAKIIITAVDKHDVGSVVFARIKPHLETKVWRQLLPVRLKHEQRRIARIMQSLRALEYEEVDSSGEAIAF
jgi:hypothetical protein